VQTVIAVSAQVNWCYGMDGSSKFSNAWRSLFKGISHSLGCVRQREASWY
jgi:hypothetical protein